MLHFNVSTAESRESMHDDAVDMPTSSMMCALSRGSKNTDNMASFFLEKKGAGGTPPPSVPPPSEELSACRWYTHTFQMGVVVAPVVV